MKSIKSRFSFLFALSLIPFCLMAIGCSQREYVERPSGHGDPDAVSTAEELFAELEKKADKWSGKGHRTSNLPAEELEIVALSLRKKYPIESLRDRLHLQSNHPNPVVRVPTGSGREYQDGYFSQRSRALSELHSDEVNRFINRNGQGVTRSPAPEPGDLRLWGQYATRVEQIAVDSVILGETVYPLPKSNAEPDAELWDTSHYALNSDGMPSEEQTSKFHDNAQRGFAASFSLGYVKNIDEVAGFEPHRIRFGENEVLSMRGMSKENLAEVDPELTGLNVAWKLNRLELVSLLIHDQPAVYELEHLPNMEELSGVDVETRPLNSFENENLDRLKEGQNVIAVATRNRIVMLGAIRAGASCIECHSVKNGDLLGAFSYEFLRNPRVAEPKSKSDSF